MKKLTTQEFVDRAHAVHGDRYGYAFSIYERGHKKVMIYCREHGFFEQTPSMHLSGQGCKHCSGNNHKTKGVFIEQARAVHGDKYDYSLVDYISSNIPVNIVCKIHGSFMQRPNTHINRKQGCRICSGYAKDTEKSFIEKARKIHSEKYDYSLVEYVTSQVEVNIICSVHGVFSQRPNDHIIGVGCPGCSNWGFNTTKEGFIYLLRSHCGSFCKIGITHSPKRRHSQLCRVTPFKFDVVECLKGPGSLVFSIEKELLKSTPPVVFDSVFDGSTEWRLWDESIRTRMLTLMDEGHSHV